MQIRILYFAAARDLAGCSTETVELAEGATAQTALNSALQRHPALRAIAPTLRLAVNETFATKETPLAADNQIALLPPVSGG